MCRNLVTEGGSDYNQSLNKRRTREYKLQKVVVIVCIKIKYTKEIICCGLEKLTVIY